MFARELSAQDRIANRLNVESVEDCPQFLAIASWYELHQHAEYQESLRDIVYPADLIDDMDYSDEKHLFGFNADIQGVRALTTLRKMQPAQVFIHDGMGTYTEVKGAFIDQLNIGTDGAIDADLLQAVLQGLMQDDDMSQHIRRDPKPVLT